MMQVSVGNSICVLFLSAGVKLCVNFAIQYSESWFSIHIIINYGIKMEALFTCGKTHF